MWGQMARRKMKISKSEIWTNFTIGNSLIIFKMLVLVVQKQKIILFDQKSVFSKGHRDFRRNNGEKSKSQADNLNLLFYLNPDRPVLAGPQFSGDIAGDGRPTKTKIHASKKSKSKKKNSLLEGNQNITLEKNFVESNLPPQKVICRSTSLTKNWLR